MRLVATFLGYEDSLQNYGVFKCDGVIKLLDRVNCPNGLMAGDQVHLEYGTTETGGKWYVQQWRKPPGDWIRVVYPLAVELKNEKT